MEDMRAWVDLESLHAGPKCKVKRLRLFVQVGTWGLTYGTKDLSAVLHAAAPYSRGKLLVRPENLRLFVGPVSVGVSLDLISRHTGP